MPQHGFGQQRVGDRRWIGEPGGLDHHPAKIRYLAARSPRQQLAQRPLQVATHRAAQAAIAEQQRVLRHALQQMMIEPNLAEFVDQHGYVGEVGRAQQPLQQRGFPAAEKSGDDVDGREFAVIRHRRSVQTQLGERRQIRLVERIKRSPGKALGGRPKVGDGIDDRGAAGASGEQIRAARPILHRDAVTLQNSVEQARACLALAPAGVRFGAAGEDRRRCSAVAPMAFAAENTAQCAHRNACEVDPYPACAACVDAPCRGWRRRKSSAISSKVQNFTPACLEI